MNAADSEELARRIHAVLQAAGRSLWPRDIAKRTRVEGQTPISPVDVLGVLQSKKFGPAFEERATGWALTQTALPPVGPLAARDRVQETAPPRSSAVGSPPRGPPVLSTTDDALGAAILAERDAQRRARPHRPVRVTSIALVQALPTGKFIYEITVSDRLRLQPDQPIKLTTPDGVEIHAEVIEAEGHTVSCVVGQTLSNIRFKLDFDPAFIMTALHKRLTEEAWTERGLAEVVMRRSGWSALVQPSVSLPPAIAGLAGRKLNHKQFKAYTRAMCERIHLIWGPPGTGKTTTLGETIRTLVAAGRSALLVSLSHVAVDQMCLSFLGGASEELKHALVRHGTARDRTLDAYSPDAATARDCPELVQKLAELQATLVELDRHIRAHQASRPAAKARLAAEIGDRAARRERVQAEIRALKATVATERTKAISSRTCHAATLAALVVSKSLDAFAFDAVVLDEASMVAMPWVMAAAARAERQFIVAGDPMQLPPIVTSGSGPAKSWFSNNMFTHVGVDDPTSHPNVTFLDEQHRMPAEVANLVSNLSYQGKLRTAASRASRTSPDEGIFFVSTEGVLEGKAVYSRHVRSFYNPMACPLLAALSEELRLSAAEPTYLLAPFRSQARLLEAVARDLGLVETRVGTIHTAQGSERSTVIIDLTEHDPAGIRRNRLLGDDSFRQLLNVAISRTQNRLVLIGHPAAFDRLGSAEADLRAALARSRNLSARTLLARAPPAPTWPPPGEEWPKRRALYVVSPRESTASARDVSAWMSGLRSGRAELVVPSTWSKSENRTAGVQVIPIDDIPPFALCDDLVRVRADGVWRLVRGGKTGDVLRDLAIGHVVEAETTAESATARLLCRRCERGTLELDASGRLACAECHNTRLMTMADGPVLANLYGLECPSCVLPLRSVQGPSGIFFSCPNHPDCTHTRSGREIRGYQPPSPEARRRWGA